MLHRRAAAFAAAGTGAESRRCGDDEAHAPVRRGREGSMLDLRFGWSIASSSAMRYRSNGLCRPCDPPLLPRTPGLRVHAPFVTWPPCSPGGATAPLTVADARSGGAGCSPEEKAALAICGDRWGRLVTSACSPPYTVCVTLLWVVRHPASTHSIAEGSVCESRVARVPNYLKVSATKTCSSSSSACRSARAAALTSSSRHALSNVRSVSTRAA